MDPSRFLFLDAKPIASPLSCRIEDRESERLVMESGGL